MSFEGQAERLHDFRRDDTIEAIIDGLNNMTDVQLAGILQQIKAREGVSDNG